MGSAVLSLSCSTVSSLASRHGELHFEATARFSPFEKLAECVLYLCRSGAEPPRWVAKEGARKPFIFVVGRIEVNSWNGRNKSRVSVLA